MSSLNTSIEWTNATWNPVTGCTKVSAGCKNCYAERVFPRAYSRECATCGHSMAVHDFSDHSIRNNPCIAARGNCNCIDFVERKFTDVRCHQDRLEQPLHWKRPRRIFVNSMSDLFHEDVSDEFISRVFAVMYLSRRHTYQILTKRPERMRSYLKEMSTDPDAYCYAWANEMDGYLADVTSNVWPLPNVWLGVSAENQETLLDRVPKLIGTPAVVHFISYEPALGPIDLHAIVADDGDGPARDLSWIGSDARIDWLIAGGESGPDSRPPQIEWFRAVRDQCQAANVPFFFKQWGEWAPRAVFGERPLSRTRGEMVRIGKKAAGANLDGREWREFPKILAVEEIAEPLRGCLSRREYPANANATSSRNGR